MKRFLLPVVFGFNCLVICAQIDTTGSRLVFQGSNKEDSGITVTIYPVPVRDNSFTIKCDRGISALKITNIIGQDIHSVKYSDPLNSVKIILENPRRGMYLVTLLTSDNRRTVKKIMVEGNS